MIGPLIIEGITKVIELAEMVLKEVKVELPIMTVSAAPTLVPVTVTKVPTFPVAGVKVIAPGSTNVAEVEKVDVVKVVPSVLLNVIDEENEEAVAEYLEVFAYLK